MDFRILLAGILSVMISGAGSFLLVATLGLSLEVLIALLLLVLPLIALSCYHIYRMQELEFLIRHQGRLIQSAIGEHSSEMSRRYAESMDVVMEMNKDLRRRIYR